MISNPSQALQTEAEVLATLQVPGRLAGAASPWAANVAATKQRTVRDGAAPTPRVRFASGSNGVASAS